MSHCVHSAFTSTQTLQALICLKIRLLWISAPEVTGPFGWLSASTSTRHHTDSSHVTEGHLQPLEFISTYCPLEHHAHPPKAHKTTTASWSQCHIYSNQPFIHKTAAEIGLLSLKINNLFSNPHGKFQSPNHRRFSDSSWRKCALRPGCWVYF